MASIGLVAKELDVGPADIAPLDEIVHGAIIRLTPKQDRIKPFSTFHIRRCQGCINALDLHFSLLYSGEKLSLWRFGSAQSSSSGSSLRRFRHFLPIHCLKLRI
jgi:hypothetical protein